MRENPSLRFFLVSLPRGHKSSARLVNNARLDTLLLLLLLLAEDLIALFTSGPRGFIGAHLRLRVAPKSFLTTAAEKRISQRDALHFIAPGLFFRSSSLSPAVTQAGIPRYSARRAVVWLRKTPGCIVGGKSPEEGERQKVSNTCRLSDRLTFLPPSLRLRRETYTTYCHG